MNIPNILTLGRIVLVPLVIWLIITHEMTGGTSRVSARGSDRRGRRLHCQALWLETELGAYLDPIADKALLVSIYVTLGLAGHLPVWLVIAVVSRDILIVGAVVLSWMLSRPLSMQPLPISKANTFAQIVLAGLVLAELGIGLGLKPVISVLIWVTGALTIVSAAAYFWRLARAYGELRAGAAAASAAAKRKGASSTSRDRPRAARFVTLDSSCSICPIARRLAPRIFS